MLTIDLDTPCEPGRAAIGQLSEQGFVKLGGVLPGEVLAAYKPEITGKVIELNTMHLPMAERSTYLRAFLQVENLWQHSERVREPVFSARLARLAGQGRSPRSSPPSRTAPANR